MEKNWKVVKCNRGWGKREGDSKNKESERV